MINYKFNEDKILQELKEYIDSTYTQHYSSDENPNAAQTLELWNKHPLRGVFGCLKDVIKYVDRYGTKDGFNEKDLWKAIHYLILAIECHKRILKQNSNFKDQTLSKLSKADSGNSFNDALTITSQSNTNNEQ